MYHRNVIAPGFIETPMTDVLNDDRSLIIKQCAIRAVGQGSEIAAAVVYLASQEAGYVTGATYM